MKELTRILLAGSPAEIEERASAAGRLLAADQQAAGMHLLELAIALAANPNLQVWVATYADSSQGLQVALQGAPQYGAVTVSRNRSGTCCAIGWWNPWAPVGTDTNIASTAGVASAAGVITAIVGLGMPQTRDGGTVVAVGRTQDDMQTAELVAAYRHARALARSIPPGPLAKALAGWMFTARRVLDTRGKNVIDPGLS